jgi:transposase-like protein
MTQFSELSFRHPNMTKWETGSQSPRILQPWTNSSRSPGQLKHVEQDHRGIKRRVNAGQGFPSFDGVWRTIQGYEVIHMIRKAKWRWLPKGDVVGQILS